MPETVRILDKYIEAAGHSEVAPNNYRGLAIHALYSETHEKIAEYAAAILQPGAEILDLGAGSGALCLRLEDAGFKVTACDAVAENFRLHRKVPFHIADLNGDFSGAIGGPFDAITATEIIEHLENPRHFLRECRKLLRPGGKLILSTPNTDSAISRAQYVRTGDFRMFSDDYYRNDGHITPVSRGLLARALAEAKFRVVKTGSVGTLTFPRFVWLRMRVLAWLLRQASSHADEQGDIFLLAAEKL